MPSAESPQPRRGALVTTLLRTLRSVPSRRRGVALALCGGVGIGKTWMAHHLLRALPCRHIVLRAAAPGAALVKSFPPPDRAPPWVKALLPRLARGEHVELLTAATGLATHLSALTPAVVLVEDLHECPVERLELWRALAGEVTRMRGLGLVATSRTPPPPPFDVHLLDPLTLPESVELLETEVGSRLPADAVEWIFQRAAGNPLFTLEYFRHLARQGHLWSDGRRWLWRPPADDLMPSTLEAIIASAVRAAARPATVEAVALAMALVPPDTSDAVCAAVAGVSPREFVDACAVLLRGGVFLGHDFAHPLYRARNTRNSSPIS